MKLHPYHTADGRLWPELDDRVVGFPTLCAYEGLSRWSVYQRALAGHYGKPSQASGAWVEIAPNNPKSVGRWKFRPAVIWRNRGWGRYAAMLAFDPRSVREPIYCCNPVESAKRIAAAPPSAPSLEQLVQGIVQGITAAIQPATPDREPQIPRLPHILQFPLAR
jgi:hypothetical protein